MPCSHDLSSCAGIRTRSVLVVTRSWGHTKSAHCKLPGTSSRGVRFVRPVVPGLALISSTLSRRPSLIGCPSFSDRCNDELPTTPRAICHPRVRGTRSGSAELAYHELRCGWSLGPAAGYSRSGHWSLQLRSLRQQRQLLRAGRKARPCLDSFSR
jgi:hypothetical protein